MVGDEVPLEGTEAISPSFFELKSVVERADTFVGIRSGLCDVIREVKAKKIALYPDYNYCDTKWILVLKAGDKLQIGENVVIKLQSDSRAQLAIDAPREVQIKRITAEKKEKKTEK